LIPKSLPVHKNGVTPPIGSREELMLYIDKSIKTFLNGKEKIKCL
jgi:hypothetical protein